MTRLSYSPGGFLRRIHIGRDSLYLIVEGRTHDPVFYDRLCESSNVLRRAGYQVWLSEQISNGAGGKAAMLGLFDEYREKATLSFPGRTARARRSIAFCLDRDADHLVGGTRRSPHVLYTQLADVEAEIFTHGSDMNALSIAASLDGQSARGLVEQLGDWRADLADLMRSWIELCCLALTLSSRCPGVGFRQHSLVNGPNSYEPVRPVDVQSVYGRLAAESPLTPTEQARRERRLRRRIELIYRRGEGWSLVKGKWIPRYLTIRVRTYFGSAPAELQDLTRHLTKAYLGTIDFSGAWAVRYHAQLESLVVTP
jgi:hypothetical protein